MLTKTDEEEQEACYQYWSPIVETAVIYGKLSIKTKKINAFRYHVVTRLRVSDDTGRSLDVKHFAFTDWPYCSIPQHSSYFLEFVLSVRAAQLTAELYNKSEDYPPMVVHCSAGLNRTGAFCAIDICISRCNETAIISLSSVVSNLRKQRNNCLFLSEHYVFCYEIMVHYVKLDRYSLGSID